MSFSPTAISPLVVNHLEDSWTFMLRILIRLLSIEIHKLPFHMIDAIVLYNTTLSHSGLYCYEIGRFVTSIQLASSCPHLHPDGIQITSERTCLLIFVATSNDSHSQAIYLRQAVYRQISHQVQEDSCAHLEPYHCECKDIVLILPSLWCATWTVKRLFPFLQLKGNDHQMIREILQHDLMSTPNACKSLL